VKFTDVAMHEDYQPDSETISKIVLHLSVNDRLVMQGLEGEFICYKPTYFHTEQNLAERVYQLLQHKHHPDPERVKAWIDRYTTQRNIQLSPKTLRSYSPSTIV